jgi:chromosome segregation ATPase
MKDTPTFIDKTIDNYNNELTKACLREQLLKEDCQDLERELTAARAEITILKSKYADHHAEAERLTSEIRLVTEQRDDLLRYNEAFRKETLICADCDSISKEEYDQAIERVDGLRSGIDYASDQLHKVTEQRDRLAEAIRKHKETLPFAPQPCDKKLYEALQSLTTNELCVTDAATI